MTSKVERNSLGQQIVFDVIDTLCGEHVLITYPTRRKAKAYCDKLEPTPFYADGEEWRYLIRPRTLA